MTNPVLSVPPASPATAAAHFAAQLAYQTDVSDVHAAIEAGARSGSVPGFVLVDTRGAAAWDQGHVPGAHHLPTGEIAVRAPIELDPAVPVVAYCWGPGCNGSTVAALAFAGLGYRVKEMIGGMEYWIREGLPVQGPDGITRGAPDPLTSPRGAIACAC